MSDLFFPPDWLTTTGDIVKPTASLAAGTYYAVIRKQGVNRFGGTFVSDGTIVATATVDGNDAPSSLAAATDYAATGTGGWTDESAITDVSITAASTSFALGHVTDFERGRARVKLVVSTPGVVAFHPTIPGG
jgi:hypothetical protein